MPDNMIETKSSDSIRLLLVDDEDSFRETLAKRLLKRGLDALQADCGEQGLEILARRLVDVVVMDVKMPGMSGLDVLGRIKAQHPKIQVILLTGHSATRDGVAGIKAGAFDYLTKPVELDHLIRKIRQAHEMKVNTEHREQQAAYKAQIEQQMIATERLAALGTLAAGVAHEINNPLAIINESAGFLALLLGKPEMSDIPRRADFQKAVEKIETGVRRARAITHQLLGSVRKHDPVVSQVDLEELAGETLQLVRREAADKQIEMTLATSGGLAPVWIDPNQIRQVLINLLTNAIHATGARGAITVGIEKHADRIVLSVADTGKGIARENMEKIFEPFFSDKPPGQGTGLGLFVTREIVEKLGGVIDVKSRLGAGTTVTITIPLQHTQKDN